MADVLFRKDGRYVVAGWNPAAVCAECSEGALSREAAEKRRSLLRGSVYASMLV